MRHYTWTDTNSYEIGILVKDSLFSPSMISKYYGVQDFNEDVVLFNLDYANKKTPPVGIITNYLDALLEEFNSVGTKLLIVSDAPYFKKLAKVQKVDKYIGEVLPAKYKGYEDFLVAYVPSYSTAAYSPSVIDSINLCINNIKLVLETGSTECNNFLTEYEYVTDVQRQADILEELLTYDELGCDTETFSLGITQAGLGTISFATSQTTGYTFYIEAVPREDGSLVRVDNQVALDQLRDFFNRRTMNLVYHNSTFDIKVIIYALYMRYDLTNYEGLVDGLDRLCTNFDDTKILTWCALNSTSQTSLSLKDNTREYAGNYGIDVTDIMKQTALELAEYNLKDSCCTLYLKYKYLSQVKDENLYKPYSEILLDSVKPIVHSELTGLPVDMEETKVVYKDLSKLLKSLMNKLYSNKHVIKFTSRMNLANFKAKNASLKTKVISLSEFDEKFNPNSPKQLINLLYNMLELPVIAYSDGGDPSTGNKVIKKLIHHTDDPVAIELIELIMEIADVTKLHGTFIKGLLEKSVMDKNGQYWIMGSFNIGGTKSGRLSSTGGDHGLNLQQLPSGSDLAHYFKRCIRAPKGWVLTGADFALT